MPCTLTANLKAALVILLTLPLTSTLTSMVAGKVTASENLTSSPVRIVPGPGRLVAIRPVTRRNMSPQKTVKLRVIFLKLLHLT